MSQQVVGQSQGTAYEARIKFTIPDFDSFAELLHDRLHAILYHYEEWESKFMLITNLYDRDPKRIQKRRITSPEDVEVLIDCGKNRQRIILEKDNPITVLSINPNYIKKYYLS